MADALRVQLNIRQNAEELQDILKDLDSWQDEVKTKDEELRHSKIVVKKVWFFYYVFGAYIIWCATKLV